MAKNGFRPSGMGGMGGNMNQLMKQAQKMQEDMLKKQEEMDSREFEASSGGGVVTAVVYGSKTLKSIKISPDAVDPDDIEMLEDLVVAAVNAASEKASETVNGEMGKLTGGLRLGF